jgi:hypothetical protein
MILNEEEFPVAQTLVQIFASPITREGPRRKTILSFAVLAKVLLPQQSQVRGQLGVEERFIPPFRSTSQSNGAFGGGVDMSYHFDNLSVRGFRTDLAGQDVAPPTLSTTLVMQPARRDLMPN